MICPESHSSYLSVTSPKERIQLDSSYEILFHRKEAMWHTELRGLDSDYSPSSGSATGETFGTSFDVD